jgi:hypothetical protein
MHEVLSTRHTDEPLSPEMGIGLILAVRLPSLIACDGSERESGAGGLTREVEAPLPSNHPRRRAEHRSNRIPHRAMLHTVPVEYHTVLCRTEAMALLGMTRTAPCGIDCGSTAAAARGLAALHRSPPSQSQCSTRVETCGGVGGDQSSPAHFPAGTQSRPVGWTTQWHRYTSTALPPPGTASPTAPALGWNRLRLDRCRCPWPGCAPPLSAVCATR